MPSEGYLRVPQQIEAQIDADRKASPGYQENMSTAQKILDGFQAFIDRLRQKIRKPQPPEPPGNEKQAK